MSAPLRLTASDTKCLYLALESLTKITRDTGVRFDGYEPLSVKVTEDALVRVEWDSTEGYGEYVVVDQVGS